MSLAHEHHCQPGFIDLLDSVKDFLTREDMSRFKKMCKKGVHVDGGEYFLYEQYISYVVEGETQSVEVSIGMTTDEQDEEDEATGWGQSHLDNVALNYYFLWHQMSAYVAYMQFRSAQEKEYFDQFMVSFCSLMPVPNGPFI